MPTRPRQNAGPPRAAQVGSAPDPPRKTGWQVRTSVAEAVKQAVDAGAAQSQNAFVERALIRELRELRRRKVYDAYAQASADPAFMGEMSGVTHAFEETASDGLVASEA